MVHFVDCKMFHIKATQMLRIETKRFLIDKSLLEVLGVTQIFLYDSDSTIV